ncbi:FAD binding domain-containing protein [Methylomicrobium sp. Wu6]|uniref:FAD binding domain-containing protein n=1 Tax=Methylomicrobium sp. Wu6 TaxID=3107928 RepID=UPI002DD680BB|nr:FAD binding domain-containing protein [Methylomicrobium sp. Wu6]MEC4749275.1 FAD binding domain-containing protein [Methylomicrobium sp. Wu6]
MSVASEAVPFLLNRDKIEEKAGPGVVLLDIIRRVHHLTGTKEACREGDCGACMVLLGTPEASSRMRYVPVNSCLLPLGAVAGCHLVTIEGINGPELNPIQQMLVAQGGIQCGFCTPGFVIALTAFFLNSINSDAAAAMDAVAGNLCRCTGYAGIKRTIQALCSRFDLSGSPQENRIRDCIDWHLLPRYFASIPEKLASLPRIKPAPGDSDAVRVAGGTDLFVQKPEILCSAPLNFLRPENSAECVRLQDGRCIIDAATTIEQLRTSQALQNLFPAIDEDFRRICCAPIRQRATVGGNLFNASPIADLAVFFLALDARLHIDGPMQERPVRLRDFFKAYKQIDCGPDELLREISLALPEPPFGFSFEKVSKRTYLDIASVNSALLIELSNGVIQKVCLSAGGVAPIPLYLNSTCEFLLGKAVREEVVLEAARVAQSEIAPISDIRGTADYKGLLLRQLIFAHFLKLFPEQLCWEALHETA